MVVADDHAFVSASACFLWFVVAFSGCSCLGVRLLDGAATDALEAQALKFNCENIDICSNSWGPADNGKVVEAVGPLTLQALEFCIARVSEQLIYSTNNIVYC